MSLKIHHALIFVFLIGTVSYEAAYGQVDPYKNMQRVVIIESQNDSNDIINNFYNVFDSLSIFFAFDTLYDSFDKDQIHYPKQDFSDKEDTTVIQLVDNRNYFFANPYDGELTSHFGLRGRRYHYGTDINLETGDSIHSCFDGVVRITKHSSSYGYVVVVRHFNGLETLYAHLSRIDVQPDQHIRAGECIGLGGNTGRSRGSHLHFEIRYLGCPIDPEDIIDFENCQLRSDKLLLSKYHFRYLKEVKQLKRAKVIRVRRGDTLSKIAERYNTSVSTLCKLNKLKRTAKLKAGKRIRIS